jgi:hypothetical protein
MSETTWFYKSSEAPPLKQKVDQMIEDRKPKENTGPSYDIFLQFEKVQDDYEALVRSFQAVDKAIERALRSGVYEPLSEAVNHTYSMLQKMEADLYD